MIFPPERWKGDYTIERKSLKEIQSNRTRHITFYISSIICPSSIKIIVLRKS